MSSETPVTVLAIIRVKPGSESEARTMLSSIVPDTLQEPGCLAYDLHQSISDPAEFLFYERWSSDAALDAHAASTAPHRLKLRESLGTLVDGRPSVTRWRRAE